MSKRNGNDKNKIRSALSGRIINGKDVILTEEAKEYVIKMGYILTPIMPLVKFDNALKKVVGFMFFFLVLMPFISAQPAIFVMDFAQRQNQIILLILFAISGVMFWFRNFLFAGTFVCLAGMLMAFNSINIIVSLFVLVVGVFILTQDGRE